MNVFKAQSHWDSAVALYRQRDLERAMPELDASAVDLREKRMRLHLHVLGRCDWPDLEEEGAPAVFVMLARRMSSPDPEIRQEGYTLACEKLAEGGADREGAFAALALFPEHQSDSLLDLHVKTPALRPFLFDLWREQSYSVPAELLDPDELNKSDEATRVAGVSYAAEQSSVGIEFFRLYYQARSNEAAFTGRLLAVALRGALLRGDEDALPILRRCAQRESDPHTLFELLRLAALVADRESLPMLRDFMQTYPAQGAHLLALYGTREAIDMLLEGLASAATMDAAASAWKIVIGESLPAKTRLQVVGAKAGEGQGLMPDAEVARQEWRTRREKIPSGGRILYGDPVTLPHLYALASTKAGQIGTDFLDMLALRLGRPLGVVAGAEQSKRRSVLRRISTERHSSSGGKRDVSGR